MMNSSVSRNRLLTKKVVQICEKTVIPTKLVPCLLQISVGLPHSMQQQITAGRQEMTLSLGQKQPQRWTAFTVSDTKIATYALMITDRQVMPHLMWTRLA